MLAAPKAPARFRRLPFRQCVSSCLQGESKTRGVRMDGTPHAQYAGGAGSATANKAVEGGMHPRFPIYDNELAKTMLPRGADRSFRFGQSKGGRPTRAEKFIETLPNDQAPSRNCRSECGRRWLIHSQHHASEMTRPSSRLGIGEELVRLSVASEPGPTSSPIFFLGQALRASQEGGACQLSVQWKLIFRRHRPGPAVDPPWPAFRDAHGRWASIHSTWRVHQPLG